MEISSSPPHLAPCSPWSFVPTVSSLKPSGARSSPLSVLFWEAKRKDLMIYSDSGNCSWRVANWLSICPTSCGSSSAPCEALGGSWRLLMGWEDSGVWSDYCPPPHPPRRPPRSAATVLGAARWPEVCAGLSGIETLHHMQTAAGNQLSDIASLFIYLHLLFWLMPTETQEKVLILDASDQQSKQRPCCGWGGGASSKFWLVHVNEDCAVSKFVICPIKNTFYDRWYIC